MDNAFLLLVRLGIGKESSTPIQMSFNWKYIKTLAAKQQLSAIVIDGIERIPESLRPPKGQLIKWIGDVIHEYENRYIMFRRCIAEMAGFYNSHGYRMMLLKGFACSLDWPRPEHRPCGDIDIWQFGRQKEADFLLTTEKGIRVNTDEHHHTVFYWRDFMVENHFDFINVHHHKSNLEYEAILKELGQDDSHSIDVCGEKVYIPSPDLHALFLIKHLMLHFASGEINLRQLLDWAFFVEKHSKEVDWNKVLDVIERFGMTPAFNTFNAICVEDLGFESCFFPSIKYNALIKDKVLSDIILPFVPDVKPEGIIRRVIWKFRRWKANEWKHELCYNESMWSAFWSGVKTHLLKPSSI